MTIPILFSPKGLPPGATLYHDFYFPNILLQSETFSSTSWAKTRSTIVPNVLADPISGDFTVVKLAENHEANTWHHVSQNIGISLMGTEWFILKAGERPWVKVCRSSDDKGAYFNLSTGATGTVDSGVTAYIESVGNGFYKCQITLNPAISARCYMASANDVIKYNGLGHSGTCQAGAGNDATHSILAATASAVDDVYNGTELYRTGGTGASSTPLTVTAYNGTTKVATHEAVATPSDNTTTYVVGPGIFIARAQLYPAATLPPYEVTTDLQTLVDKRGNYNLTRGISTADTTNDYTVLGLGAGFVTDDCGLTGNLSTVLAGPWTAMVVAKPAWAADTDSLITLRADADNYAAIEVTAADAAKATWKATTAASSDTIAITAASPQVLALTADTTLTIERMDTGASAAAATKTPTGTAVLQVGSQVAGTNHYDGTIYDVVLWNRALSTAEKQRAYRYLKSLWASRGIEVL